MQIGFARCVTDYAVIYCLCDVIVDESYRNMGIGTKLIEYIVQHEKLKNVRGILTANARHQGFYGQFSFEPKNSFMFKPNNPKIELDNKEN